MSRAWRITFATLSLALLLLAGCASQPPAATQAQLPVIREPGDFTSANATAPGFHIHDYWDGRESIEVLRSSSGPMRASCQGCVNGMPVLDIQPPDGSIVPQGTAWVDVAVHVEGQASPDAYELWVQTAVDEKPRRAGALTPGETFRFNSTNERNDPPHYVLSLWRFQVRVPAEDVEFSGTVDIRVEAVRGLPLVPYPAHPDQWLGATELSVLDESQSVDLAYAVRTPVSGQYTCMGGCPGRHVPPNGTVVPWDARFVDVTLTFPDGVPAGLDLWYHGANTRSFTRVEPDLTTPGTVHARIELERGQADSPYAPRSLWEVRVHFSEGLPAVAWTGTYRVEMVASK
ncbi:MAG TPA: hypothetical protein VFH47_02000 [Candidatus Thermoplasmatota archaeon]|nr:hypothetical protein [Candidatus Thermoplasmatota archaeon]